MRPALEAGYLGSLNYSRYKFSRWLRGHWRRIGPAYLVLLISVIPTVIAYKRVARYADERDHERLAQIVQLTSQSIESEIRRHLTAFQHLADFPAGKDHDESAWKLRFDDRDFFDNYPAFQSLSCYRTTNAGASGSSFLVQTHSNRAPVGLILVAESSSELRELPPADSDNLAPLLLRALQSNELVAAARLDAHPPTIDLAVSRTPTGESPSKVLVARLIPGPLAGAGHALVGSLITSLPARPSPPGEAPDPDTPLIRPVAVANDLIGVEFKVLPAFIAGSARHLSSYVLFGGGIVSLLLFSITLLQAKGRMRAEKLTEDLRAVQERDRMLERATNDAIWDWDIESNRLVWNEAVQAMFRYSADQVRNHPDWWLERLHPDDRRRVWNGREMAVQTGGEFWADEYRFQRGDGTYASVIDRGFILHDRQGLAERMIGSMVDVTSQKEAEEARQESERKLALHIQQTPLAVIEWNLEFKVTAWNAAAERIFGYAQSEAIGRSGATLVVSDPGQNPNPFLFSNILAGENYPSDIRKKVNAAWQQVLHQAQEDINSGNRAHLARRSINAFAVANRTKANDTIICDWYNTPLIDSTGQVVGIASLVLDVTARKEAEDALAEEKERLAVTLRSIGDGVIATDTDGRINLINKLAEELTDWSQVDAMGEPLNTVFNVVDQKTRVTYRNPLSHVLSSGEIVDLPDSSLLVSRSGTEKLIAASAAPIHDQESKIIGSVLVFRDITDEHHLQQERLRGSKLDSLGILAGGIAHDFNNILTAVIGNLSFARMFTKPGEKQHDRLEEAEKAAMRAKDLATQLLTFSKGGTPVRQTASLPEIVQDSTAFALRGSNVRCEFSMSPDLVTVEIDSGQISQVVNNLVINAVQAMPDGGVIRVEAANCRIDAESPLPLPYGDYARISVKDHGHGIAPANLAHVFDPYFTTKEKGSGLGLATSYSIVKHHDGLITVDSVVGEGTEFRIFIPASQNEIPAAVAAGNDPLEGEGRVLVMDDEEIIRELAATSLEFLGYRVDSVEDGQSCIDSYELARRNGDPYDVVIMDLTIPGGMGGVEAISRLRELDPEITAIVSSGYSSGPVLANYENHGFKGVVAKPYRVEDLAKALSTILRKERS
jgi:PAS domain S-box-containing protein